MRSLQAGFYARLSNQRSRNLSILRRRGFELILPEGLGQGKLDAFSKWRSIMNSRRTVWRASMNARVAHLPKSRVQVKRVRCFHHLCRGSSWQMH